MKPLYIVGASGAAKEIFQLVQTVNAQHKQYEFKGFIDFNAKNKYHTIGKKKYPILDETHFLNTQTQSCAIVMAIGNSKRLQTVLNSYLKKSNIEFPNMIHPNVILDDSVTLGKGNTICNASVLTVDINLGDFNYINRGVHIGHDVSIGSYNVINPCAVISGGITILDENLIGTHATILQYLSIGNRNTIGAGAVVTKQVEHNKTLIGVPAKEIKDA